MAKIAAGIKVIIAKTVPPTPKLAADPAIPSAKPDSLRTLENTPADRRYHPLPASRSGDNRFRVFRLIFCREEGDRKSGKSGNPKSSVGYGSPKKREGKYEYRKDDKGYKGYPFSSVKLKFFVVYVLWYFAHFERNMILYEINVRVF